MEHIKQAELLYICPECQAAFTTSRGLSVHQILWCGLTAQERSLKNPMYGKHHSKEAKDKIARAKRGHSIPEERKRRISETLRGRKFSKEHRRRIGNASAGRRCTEEAKRKISEAKRGHECTKETRRKMSIAQTGRKHSDETKHKMAEAKIGKQNGKNNPNWKGGITSEREKWHNNGGQRWAEAVHNQAICGLCGNPVSFNYTWDAAHHILPFAYEQFRSEPANGLLLCASCHKGVHNGSNWYAWAILNEIHWGETDNPILFREALGEAVATDEYYKAL